MAGDGYRVSEESRQKMRDAKMGKKLSKEAIQKRTEKQRGMKRSLETRARMSIAAKNRKNKCQS